MIVDILIEKILVLALMMGFGALLVRAKLLKGSDSRVLSLLIVYLILPCVIMNAFQVEWTKEAGAGLILALVTAVILHAGMLLFLFLVNRPLKLDAVEQLSILFPNCGALMVTLVMEVLGPEWVLYTSAFLAVHMFLLWSYGNSMISGESGLNVRKIFTNVNFVSILIGLGIFFSGVRLPAVISDTMSAFSSMAGPMTMLVTGMLLGDMELKKIISNGRLWLVSALRLVVVPLLTVLFLKCSGMSSLTASGPSVLLISLMAMSGPSASAITQLAQIYHRDAEAAGAINVLTTGLCIVTMPLMVWLYQL